jgi:hypothetical protein
MNSPSPTPVNVPPSVGYIGIGLAIGIALTVLLFFILGGHFGGTASSTPQSPVQACPFNTEASIGSASPNGPSVEADSISVHSHAWAAGSTETVVTKPIPVEAGSTLLVFVGFVGAAVGGPESATVCDSAGDSFFLQTSTSEFSSNHTELLFLGLDAAGGAAVSFAANFSDTSAPAGGTMAVIDLASPSPLSLSNLIAGSEVGDNGTSGVPMNANGPSFLVLGVSGQGNDGPFGALGTEVLLDTNGYYDAGPWTDGESVGSMISTTTSGPVDPSASLAVPGVWTAIAVVAT